MLDYRYTPEDGPPKLVGDMDTADIIEILRDGCEIMNCDGVEPSMDNLMERLKIEMLIRQLGLR